VEKIKKLSAKTIMFFFMHPFDCISTGNFFIKNRNFLLELLIRFFGFLLKKLLSSKNHFLNIKHII